ncbi:uncharacterized protein MYCFIDRAFT_174241 [Pseudocercospora fijiensis CIRAD86]|uniref:Uncharacterized protein n=1 Tax=Pseudocercospora fijiensis (strain CIRAD86) TaxID=383855 RepID=M3ADS1_PSEFD|nr:uncharacterized protein MYCFIDRAFT_174241 [Pseudocercospora fijiensis CIRAD86]EME82686.1 hypothetical protein MYCFIDRAFT_174241 [Pseudocercospora fijiensis CIRAD86]
MGFSSRHDGNHALVWDSENSGLLSHAEKSATTTRRRCTTGQLGLLWFSISFMLITTADWGLSHVLTQVAVFLRVSRAMSWNDWSFSKSTVGDTYDLGKLTQPFGFSLDGNGQVLATVGALYSQLYFCGRGWDSAAAMARFATKLIHFTNSRSEGGGDVHIVHDKHNQLLSEPWLDPHGQSLWKVSWAHQLHCLYLIMNEYDRLIRYGPTGKENQVEHGHAEVHTNHCFDYLRQAILCNADMTLEGRVIGRDAAPGTDGWGHAHVCRNHAEVVNWLESRRTKDKAFIISPVFSYIEQNPDQYKFCSVQAYSSRNGYELQGLRNRALSIGNTVPRFYGEEEARNEIIGGKPPLPSEATTSQPVARNVL